LPSIWTITSYRLDPCPGKRRNSDPAKTTIKLLGLLVETQLNPTPEKLSGGVDLHLP